MYLLYLDESGSTSEPQVSHFVLAGVSFFERSTHWVEQALNNVVGELTEGDIHEVELHGSPMFGGRGRFWRSMPRDIRTGAIKKALTVGIAENHAARVFAAVIRRNSTTRDCVEHAFEEICMRFDLYLAAMHRKKNTQRGIIIFDKSSTENRIQNLARTFKYQGHEKGTIRNYAEVPLFLDSQASRLIQLADLVAYSIFRSYEYEDHQFFDIIKHKFERSGSTNHGLFELL